MRFSCGPTADQKHRLRQEWHSWFAWRPVRVGGLDCRWLEWVERKGEAKAVFDMFCTYEVLEWTYRARGQ